MTVHDHPAEKLLFRVINRITRNFAKKNDAILFVLVSSTGLSISKLEKTPKNLKNRKNSISELSGKRKSFCILGEILRIFCSTVSNPYV